MFNLQLAVGQSSVTIASAEATITIAPALQPAIEIAPALQPTLEIAPALEPTITLTCQVEETQRDIEILRK